MSDWPDDLEVGPLREWPGSLTVNRQRSNFRRTVSGSYQRESVPLTDTLGLLDRELRALGATTTEILLAIAPSDFRLDGKPRAHAKAAHPGVILSFESRHGALSYPCDTFTIWQDNLRAIALALEALRKVDRYGVTKRGEQYRGFLALEATMAPAGFATSAAARAFLADVALTRAEASVSDDAVKLLRIAKRAAHPDMPGGSADTFQRVSLAEAKLRQEGLL